MINLKINKQSIISSITKVAIIFSAYLLGLKFIDQYWQPFLLFRWTTIDTIVIILLQLLLLGLSSLGWKKTIELNKGESISYTGAVEQTALILIGKYLPGKVWGIALRASTAKSFNLTSRHILTSSLFEMTMSLYTTCFFSVALLLSLHSLFASMVLITLCVFFSPLAINCGTYLLKRAGAIINKNLELGRAATHQKPQLLRITLLYLCIWCVTIVIFYQTLKVAGQVIKIETFVFISGAYLLSVAIGFVAIFSPGGIGVREGVFTIIASSVIDTTQAIEIALVLRAWNCGYDIFASIIGLMAFTKRLNTQET